MVRLSELNPGDVVAHVFDSWHRGPMFVFSRVLRVGERKIRVRSESGEEAWMFPEYFDHRVPSSDAAHLEV